MDLHECKTISMAGNEARNAISNVRAVRWHEIGFLGSFYTTRKRSDLRTSFLFFFNMDFFRDIHGHHTIVRNTTLPTVKLAAWDNCWGSV
jgi:hypothetical protein